MTTPGLNTVVGVTPRTIVPVVQVAPFESESVKTARDMAPAPSTASEEPRTMASIARRPLAARATILPSRA